MFKDVTQLAQLIDHTVVRPDATLNDLAAACDAAKTYRFAAVAVNGANVMRARELLSDTLVKVCAVVGFPFGANTTTVKIVEAMEAVKNGASELDFVINIGMVKSGRYDAVEIDIKNIIAMTPQKVHKVIIETGCLTEDEIKRVCLIAMRAGAEYIKTSTGFGPRGATVSDVRLIQKIVGSGCRVKASGGIRDLHAVQAMVEAGADRVGTSTGVAIINEYLKARESFRQ